MPFCYQCGKKFTLGDENFCSNCGYNLQNGRANRNIKSFEITKTKGDVIGPGISGSGNLAGKEIEYVVQGNVINISIGGGSLSQEVLSDLQKVLSLSTQVEPPLLEKNIIESDKDFKTKEDESGKTHKQIKEVLDEVNKAEKKSGRNIEQIKMGDMQISKKELSLKELILEGNEHYYKKEYSEAIECYNKVLDINPDNIDAWHNKGNALKELGQLAEV